MLPLTPDDLLPLDEYLAQREDIVRARRVYLDRYRRVPVGPRVTFIFENRQTVWYRLHEFIRAGRLTDPRLIRRELDLMNRLLPKPGRLAAALVLDGGRSDRPADPLWRSLTGPAIRLEIGANSVAADLLTCRPEDLCAGTAHWVEFAPGPAATAALIADDPAAVRVRVDCGSYQFASSPLTAAQRRGIADDLTISRS